MWSALVATFYPRPLSNLRSNNSWNPKLPMGLLATKSQASITIARSFSSLSFLNAHLVGLSAKEYFRTIHPVAVPGRGFAPYEE